MFWLHSTRLRNWFLRLIFSFFDIPYVTTKIGFRTLSESGARFHIYQQRRPSFAEPPSGSLNSTPNSATKSVQFRSGSSITPSGNPSSGDGLIYYDHKYSEPMRQINFQYVNDEVCFFFFTEILPLCLSTRRNHFVQHHYFPVEMINNVENYLHYSILILVHLENHLKHPYLVIIISPYLKHFNKDPIKILNLIIIHIVDHPL